MARGIAGCCAIVLTLLVVSSLAAQVSNTDAAQSAADAWLGLVDQQNDAASWQTAASMFRLRVSQDQWEKAVHAARDPLGAVKSRTLKSATAATSLPGAPDGDYVVFLFDTSFEHKAAAVETLTTMREADGSWHVAGYFIK